MSVERYRGLHAKWKNEASLREAKIAAGNAEYQHKIAKAAETQALVIDIISRVIQNPTFKSAYPQEDIDKFAQGNNRLKTLRFQQGKYEYALCHAKTIFTDGDKTLFYLSKKMIEDTPDTENQNASLSLHVRARTKNGERKLTHKYKQEISSTIPQDQLPPETPLTEQIQHAFGDILQPQEK